MPMLHKHTGWFKGVELRASLSSIKVLACRMASHIRRASHLRHACSRALRSSNSTPSTSSTSTFSPTAVARGGNSSQQQLLLVRAVSSWTANGFSEALAPTAARGLTEGPEAKHLRSFASSTSAGLELGKVQVEPSTLSILRMSLM